MPIIQRPSALGLMLCDQALFEQDTQKPSLVGIFTGMPVDHFPSPLCRFDLFAALTDGLGEGLIDLVVLQEATDEEIYTHAIELSFPNPLKIVNLRFRFRALSFPAPGLYLFSLLLDGETIAHRRLEIYEVEDLS